MTEPTAGKPGYANPIQAPGTEEDRWRDWDGLAALPEFPLPTAGRVVVVAAHPDDEVLGVGGIIALLTASGIAVTVVSVTEGERSHEASRTVTPERLAEIRAAELDGALGELGPVEVVRLKVPDTEVAFREDEVIRALATLLPGAALCLAPWIGDVHGDHEAAGRAALAAAREADVPCRMYPVWMWHWARPDDSRVPWTSAARVPLPEPVLGRKRAAVGHFTSQTAPLGPSPEDAPVLPPGELAHHLRDLEVLFA